MKIKNLTFSEDARQAMKRGVDKVADSVQATLGPRGRNVLIQLEYGYPIVTKDGVTVANRIKLKDPIENMGASLIQQVATKTNDKVADGTTTATILTRAIITEGLKSIVAGVNPLLLKRGLDIAKDQVINFIKNRSVSVSTNDEIKKIATISANDEKIGSVIAEMIEKLGTETESVITVKESQIPELRYEVVKGMKIDRGYMTGWMLTRPEEMKCELQDVPVFVTDMKITNTNQVRNILEPISASGKKFAVIICEDMSADALSLVVKNIQVGSFFTLVIKAPNYGEQKEEILKDICAISGATECLASSGRKLENGPVELDELGTFDRVVATRDDTIFEGGHGEKDEVDARIASIRTMLERSDSKIDINRLKDRLGKLSGGVGIIHVGGSVDVETKEMYHRVEDAVGATKAAIDGGYVPGGGLTLVEASTLITEDEKAIDDVNVGIRILRNALTYPMQIIAKNAGYNGDVVVGKVKDLDVAVADNDPLFNCDDAPFNGIGFDALNLEYVKMADHGIIDPAKVVISALQNAVGVASLILTTECVITEDENDKSQNEMIG